MNAPAQTTVRFHIDHPGPRAARLRPGIWWLTPAPGPTSATTRLAPKAFPVRPTAEEVEQGWFLLDLFATDDPAWTAPWCWKVREPYPGAIRYLAIPGGEQVDYAALVEVDPANLPVTPGAPAVALEVPTEEPAVDVDPSPGYIGGYVSGLL